MSDLAELIERAKLPELTTFVAGQAEPGGGEAFDVFHPGNGERLGEVRASDRGQAEAAIAAAGAAFKEWSGTSSQARAAVLLRTADALIADLERLAHLIALDNGKTIGEARIDVFAAADLLRSAAGWATRLKGTTLPVEGLLHRFTWLEPVGVVAVFMPYNAPLMFSAMKIGAALAMGSTVVAKGPERSPYAAAAFMEHLQASGLPAGAANLLQGAGDVGAELVASPGTDMVSFTGSSHVGAQVGGVAAGLHKRVLLELGGKSANIVYADADLDRALAGSLAGIFKNSGQRCFSGSRILVHESIADEFVERLVAAAKELRVGNPFDPASQIGALISHGDVARLGELVAASERSGATVLCGGGRPDGAPEGGYYFAPTVIDCSSAPDAEILHQEAFGPIVAIQRFSTVDEAIALANSTTFALAGGCWTKDIATGLRTAKEIDAGMFWINSYGVHGGAETTIGGRRSSGFGQEMGEQGVLAYTNTKSVLIDHGHGDSVLGM